MSARAMQTYVVSYRTGGTLSCQWHRVLGRFSLDEAVAKRDQLMRAGYAALVERSQSAEALGLPVGWSASCVDWERDKIVYGQYHTEWTSHELLAA